MLFVLLLSFVVVCASDYGGIVAPDPMASQEKTGSVTIGSGRNKRFVQLDGRQSNIQFQNCELPSGKPGLCKPAQLCRQADFNKDYIRFMENLCIMEQSKIGVCCAVETNAVVGPEGLAGDLPAVAANDEDNDSILKITSDNRGCGVSTRPHARVTGARPANPREWPWMASITPTGFSQYCGGVLITDRHILTAAHCTRRWEADELEVRLGEYDFKRTNDSRSYNFKVIEKRQHEDFDSTTYKNDIAILKLHRPAVFNTYVWPICLPPRGMDITNDTAVVIGWGTQSYGGPHSNVLMEVSVPVWDHQKCVQSFTDSVFDETLCAGGYEGGKDACQGDSGGPLMYQMPSGRWSVIGVVSWGIRCGEPNHPGLYAKVDTFLQWIVDNARF